MINMLGMCFNWKVIVVLAAVGVGLVFVVPRGAAAAALPLLLLAACPLSMVVMMFGMKKMPHKAGAEGGASTPSPETMRAQLADLRAEEAKLERAITEAQVRAVAGETDRTAQATKLTG
jgi:hypothetical protein